MKSKFTGVITFSILFFLFLMTFKVTLAVTAYPYPFKFKQPDGLVLTIQLKGDEKVHWAETMDGYTLLNNGKDGWEYATPDSKGDIKCSGILAREPQSRSSAETAFLQKVPKQIRFSKRQISMIHSIWDARDSAIESDVFNPNGNKNLVMILIGYTDLAFTKTQADFDALMNQVGYNLNGAVGSVKDFFLQNSYNQFNITTTVAGPYTAAHDMAYYGANDPITGDDINSNDLITEAVNLADPDVNYADFDNDGDGGVDGVYVVYAGYGEADGGGANTIWPHAGGIPTVTLDGEAISKYSCSNELRGGSGSNMTTIGVICHEFGHVCGSPDYYDTDYDISGQYDGTGSWDLMAGGSWNGNPAGSSPPHMMPIDKIRNTWITPIQLTTDASVSLSDITTNPVVYTFSTATSNEYYLIENRQKTGFNSAVPGHGLMIYHVDGNYITTAGNQINCTSHQGMFPMSAIATNTNGVHLSSDHKINVSGCPWPGSSAKTTFSDATTPNAKDWAGNNTNGALINISEAGGVITLCYKSCPAINPVFNLVCEAPSGSQIDLSWIKNAANNDVILAWNSTNTFGDPTNGTTYNTDDILSGGGTILYKGPASSFNHTGLSANTMYYYKIWSITSTPNYSGGTLANAQTLCASVATLPFLEGFEGGVIPGCWTQSNVIGANPWTISTSGTNNHPEGPHSGTYLARCRTTTVGAGYVTKLISPPINLTGITNPVLKFWHTQDKDAIWTGPDILRIYYRTSGTSEWNELAIYTSQIAAWTAETIDLPNPTANYFIAFEATVNAGYGVCIDDIRISSPVADFTADGNLSCTGSLTVNFTDNSMGPNGSWAWDIDNNGTTDYTTQNPSHTYNNPGLYSVKLTINNGAASITKENLINVMSSEPTGNTSCVLTPNSNSGNGYGIGIYRFALGNIDCTTSNNDGYYSNYTCSKWTQLELNTLYNITIRTGTANNEGAKVYIDYNDDGIFDNGEAVVTFPSNKDGTRTLSFTTLSSGIVFEKGLRLRVLSRFGSIPSTACDISSYGQAEDYTVYFKGPVWNGNTNTDWLTATNWSTNAVPASDVNIRIKTGCPNYPVLTSNVICGNLTIESGASVTVNSNIGLTVNGTLQNLAGNTGIVVKTGGSLIESTVGINATVERSIPANEWHLISSPVEGAVSGLFTGQYLQTHDENLNNYTDIILTDDPLEIMKGYALWTVANPYIAQFSGILNTGEQSYTATASSYSSPNGGWNLVGNPYPSSINWALFTVPSGINSAIYKHVDASTWATYTGGVSVPAGSNQNFIAPLQGFFVQCTSPATLQFTNAIRVHHPDNFYKNTNEVVNNLIRLEISGNGYKDETVVRLKPEATADFDGEWDAHKLFGDVPEAAQLYTNGSVPLAINVFRELAPVSVGVKAVSGAYTIAATEINDLRNVKLEDTKTGDFTELAKSSYTFNWQDGESENRFILHFTTLATPDPVVVSTTIYSYENTAIINLPAGCTGDIYIYNMAGQLVATKVSGSNQVRINLSPSGVYLVKVVMNKEIITDKVWIR